MKQLLQLVLCFCICFSISNTITAQLPDGSFAPDHSFTDLDGNSYSIYEILDEGKTIIMDISATWCPPCWDFHNSGVLEQIHEEYGPEGTDQARVIMFEGDATTNLACLTTSFGCNNTTLGDWVTGTPYPISNDNDVAELYNLPYWPTIYSICPNRQVTLLNPSGFPTAAQIENIIDNCPVSTQQVDVAAQEYLGETDYLCEETTPSTYLQNMGTENLTSAVIEVYANGVLMETVDWTGDLATYQFEQLTFSPVTLAGDTEIEIVTIAPGDTNADNDISVAQVSQAPATATMNINIEILTDTYGNEAYWALVNSAGDIVLEGGNTWVGLTNGGTGYPAQEPAGTYAANTTYNASYTIPESDCYEFIAVDSFGDGWCCNYGLGYYRVEDDAGNVLFEGGAFDDYSGGSFRSIQGAPIAAFTVVQTDNTVEVVDQSAGATDWVWNWGDGSALVAGQNPGSHVYAANGEYEICLTVENSFGTNDLCQTITISGLPVANFTYEVNNGVATFTDASDDATTWTWTFEDGASSTDQNPTYTFATDGEYEVCLTAANSVGENEYCEIIAVSIVGINDVIFNTIDIKPNPAANFVNVEFSQFKSSIENIELVNIGGQTVRTVSTKELTGNTQITIDLVDLAEGIYFVNFTTDEGYYTEKLTIGK